MPLCQLFVISICQNMRWLAFILFTWGFSKSPLSRAGGSAGTLRAAGPPPGACVAELCSPEGRWVRVAEELGCLLDVLL